MQSSCSTRRWFLENLTDKDPGILEISSDEKKMKLKMLIPRTTARSSQRGARHVRGTWHVMMLHANYSDGGEREELVLPPAILKDTSATCLLKGLESRLPARKLTVSFEQSVEKVLDKLWDIFGVVPAVQAVNMWLKVYPPMAFILTGLRLQTAEPHHSVAPRTGLPSGFGPWCASSGGCSFQTLV